MTFLVVGFLTSAIIVVLAGVSLARNGDVIAARTRLSGLGVGSVFLAVATSLPELVTDLSAVQLGEPDLAAGDLFGSSMANMLILAIVSLIPRGEMLFRKAALDHALYASLLTRVMTESSGLPPERVIGTGPRLDTAHFRHVLGEALRPDARSTRSRSNRFLTPRSRPRSSTRRRRETPAGDSLPEVSSWVW